MPVVPGVYAAIQPPDSTGIFHGNEEFVVNDSDVFVFDANFTPAAARVVIGLLRGVTDEPVRTIAYSHWHNDHVWGTQAFLAAYPGPINLIATDSTRDDILHQDQEKQQQLIDYYTTALAAADSTLARGAGDDGKPLSAEDRLEAAEQRDELRTYLVPEARTITYRLPTIAFHHRLTLYCGSREIQLLNFGRGNTRGDAVVFLPKEKVVMTGDLLVYPIPFAFGSYLSEWVAALHAIRQLEATHIIPGHGPVQSDYRYLDLVARTLASVVAQTRRAVADGKSLTTTQKRVRLETFRRLFTHGDHHLDSDWDQFVATAVQQAYLEAAHKL